MHYAFIELQWCTIVHHEHLSTDWIKSKIEALDSIVLASLVACCNQVPGRVLLFVTDEHTADKKFVNGQFGVNPEGIIKLSFRVVDSKIDNDIVRHEVIHFQQWLCGDLVFLGDNKIVWKGKTWNAKETPIDSQPWEKETEATT